MRLLLGLVLGLMGANYEVAADLEADLATETDPISDFCEFQSKDISGAFTKNAMVAINLTWAHDHKLRLPLTEIQASDTHCCDFALEHELFVANASCLATDTLNIDCNYTIIEKGAQAAYYFPGFELICVTCASNLCIVPDKEIDIPGGDDMVEFEDCSIVNNFTVTSSPADKNLYIRLNISWEPEIPDDANVTIKITTEDETGECRFSSTVPNHPLHENHFVRPIKHPGNPITPDCPLDITMSDENRSCFKKYTVPECVGTLCNCNKFKPRSKILSIDPINGKNSEMDYFLIKWDPGERTERGDPYFITEVKFSFTSGSTHYGEADFSKTDLRRNESKVGKKVFTGSNYTIAGRFTNNYTCQEIAHFEFTPQGTNSSYFLIFVIVTAFVLLIAIKRTSITRYTKKLFNFVFRNGQPECELAPIKQCTIPMSTNIQYTPAEFLDGDSYEFPREKLTWVKEIGRGAFGVVFLGKVTGFENWDKRVALKTLGERENITKEALADFIAEIEIFKKIGYHPNIVKLIGCCTSKPPYVMIMEYVPCGDLKQYLLELRKQWTVRKNQQFVFPPDQSDGEYIDPNTPDSPASIATSRLPLTAETMYTNLDDPMTPLLNFDPGLERVLDDKELQKFALQIAKGMAHLEQIPITHRDLAARNILINEYRVLKISDFGLSRAGPYINHKTKKLPLRWTAPEALATHIYDSKSDVWSFGVVLWEIGTLGAFPYEKVPDSMLHQHLQIGGRLERPEICTDQLYDLMRDCWDQTAEERPSFAELVDLLDTSRKIYVNFSHLNPSYVFPPSEIPRFGHSTIATVNLRGT